VLFLKEGKLAAKLKYRYNSLRSAHRKSREHAQHMMISNLYLKMIFVCRRDVPASYPAHGQAIKIEICKVFAAAESCTVRTVDSVGSSRRLQGR